MKKRLGVGIVGSGFMAGFHVESWQSVRDADITAICSTNATSAARLGDRCRQLGVGEPTIYTEIARMVQDPRVDAVWIVSPNFARVETVERLCEEVAAKRAELVGIACEKPLARNLAEAKRVVAAVKSAGLLHGYLENQVFAPALVQGREILWRRGAAIAGVPYLARCAEEHSGPHRPWFWMGKEQGGGVLSDMMCHSLEAGRFLLTHPERPGSLKPKAVTARIASLKWSRDSYAAKLRAASNGQVDYTQSPAEDYARAEVVWEDPEGNLLVSEATTSWSYVGAGLRLTFEVLGPEYNLSVNSLQSGAELYFSREVRGQQGEDLVEKQNADQGVLPYLPSEPEAYGYVHENRHMVQSFLAGVQPKETLDDGLLVTQLLMACYRSAELGKSLQFPIEGLDNFVPQVATGTWRPTDLVDAAHRV